MGNGVSGKASASLKAIYLEVDGRKHKVIGTAKILIVTWCFCVLCVSRLFLI